MMGADPKSFVIVTASYNNKEWYQRNLDSVFGQTYDNWRMIYINDCSTDGTGDLVNRYVHDKSYQDKVIIINNNIRRGHLANQYDAIGSIAKHEIVVNVDGDDWLAHDNVLSYLNMQYQDPNVWLTYGQFAFLSSNKPGYCKPIAQQYLISGKIRIMSQFIFSHLRTFYAGLFHHIKRNDLLYEGNFYPRAADVAIMYPMIEMAGDHALFIPEILYIYNNRNPLGFFWTSNHKDLDAKIHTHLRAQMPYDRLESLGF